MRTVHDFPNLLAQWNWERNGDLDPKDILPNSHRKVWWKCPVASDHEWMAEVKSRSVAGNGCPCCNGKKVVPSNCFAATNPILAAQWHPEKNQLTPYDVVSGSDKKVWWKCPVASDHEWMATVKDRKRGRGCPCCSGKKVVPSNCLSTTHPNLAAEWHPIKNSLTPQDVVSHSAMRVWWNCSVSPDHEWETNLYNRSNGDRCPFCNESRGEGSIVSVLKSLGIYYRREFRFDNCRNAMTLPFDFVILPPDKDPGLIEFQGIQHFESVEHFGGEDAFLLRKFRDQIKRDFCASRDLPLLEIPYTALKDIPQLIADFVASLPPRRDL